MDKKIIHTVFEYTASKFPDNPAVLHGKDKISYKELNRYADKFCAKLITLGVKPQDVIGLFFEPCIPYIISVLAAAKAGGIFMPLNTAFPEKRLKSIINKASPSLIVTDKNFKNRLTGILDNLESTDSIKSAVFCLDDQNGYKEAVNLLEPDNGSYIIFTSGSTGEPKAILGSQKGLSHFIHWEINEFSIGPEDKISLLAPLTFDVSLRDIFSAIIAGATLCIPPESIKTDPAGFLKWLDEQKITVCHCVPSIFRLLTGEAEKLDNPASVLPNLKKLLLAGEPLYCSDVIRWRNIFKDRIELVNLYGPSETTLAKMFFRIKDIGTDPAIMVPVGNPISNTAVFIMKENELCEPGEIGEIFIKTPFMSKGYYKDLNLTKESFVQNPLNPEVSDIIYKTGDIGRYRPDRSVELIGRADDQVKIRGIRVEPAEVEKNVIASPGVDQAAVTVYSNKYHDNYLTCYYTEKDKTGPDDLRAFLKERLPDYMIPSFFVKMTKLPLNFNSKIDKSALPKPEELLYMEIEYQAPQDPIQERVAPVWAEILNLKKAGVKNSFTDLGGDSLKAMRLISKIFKDFGIQVKFADIFPDATVISISKIIENALENNKKIETAGSSDNCSGSLTKEEMKILNQG